MISNRKSSIVGEIGDSIGLVKDSLSFLNEPEVKIPTCVVHKWKDST